MHKSFKATFTCGIEIGKQSHLLLCWWYQTVTLESKQFVLFCFFCFFVLFSIFIQITSIRRKPFQSIKMSSWCIVTFVLFQYHKGQINETNNTQLHQVWVQVDIPTCHFSERFLFQTLFIPNGFCSEWLFFRKVFIPKGFYSENSE